MAPRHLCLCIPFKCGAIVHENISEDTDSHDLNEHGKNMIVVAR